MYKIKAYAKLNFLLDILAKQAKFHEMFMLMRSISLYDELEFVPQSEKGLQVNTEKVIENNIIEKAYHILLSRYPQKVSHGFKVILDKNIPMGAGMGGGSADAAATVYFLNSYFGLKLNYKEIVALNLSLGSDVNFCYFGGTKIVTGVGDKLKNYSLAKEYLLVVNPKIHVSTAEAFVLWDKQKAGYLPRYKNFKDLERYSPYNAFEDVILSEYPLLKELKLLLQSLGAKFSLMTGSGSTIFAAFSSQKEAEVASASIINSDWLVKVCETVEKGVELI